MKRGRSHYRGTESLDSRKYCNLEKRACIHVAHSYIFTVIGRSPAASHLSEQIFDDNSVRFICGGADVRFQAHQSARKCPSLQAKKANLNAHTAVVGHQEHERALHTLLQKNKCKRKRAH